jgi:IMP dehydrogenase/GMP reductase
MDTKFFNSDIKLDLDDISIKPNDITNITSRSNIEIYDEHGMLPLFTAPMDTVVCRDNEKLFIDNNINVCLPRGEGASRYESFLSYSLKEFKDTYLSDAIPEIWGKKILIDMANGHMVSLINAVKEAKGRYGDKMVLMVGNVANPKTYKLLSEAGADFVRVIIGSGGGCLTSKQTGVGHPTASLIRECYYASMPLENPAKIVADGGMKSYSDVIKSLALGADYVMIGNMFNKCIDSCGKNYLWRYIPVTQNGAEKAHKLNLSVYKKFRGMSTKEVQKEWGNKVIKTSEGVIKFQKVDGTISGWVENFKHYLRSAMSYSNANNLEEFVNKVDIIRITNNGYKRFDK